MKLLRQGPQHVFALDEAQGHGGFAELDAMFALVDEDFLDLLGAQVVGITDDVADGLLGRALGCCARIGGRNHVVNGL